MWGKSWPINKSKKMPRLQLNVAVDVTTCNKIIQCGGKYSCRAICAGTPLNWPRKEKMMRKIFNLMAVLSLLNLVYPCYSAADVTNMTAYPIYLKPEKGYRPIKVNPGETFKGRHDAIIVPAQNPGKVYKTVDNVDAVVGEDGKIYSSSHDIQGALGQFFLGGWIDALPLDYKGRKRWAIYFEKSLEVEKQREQEREAKAAAAKTTGEKRLEPASQARVVGKGEPLVDQR